MDSRVDPIRTNIGHSGLTRSLTSASPPKAYALLARTRSTTSSKAFRTVDIMNLESSVHGGPFTASGTVKPFRGCARHSHERMNQEQLFTRAFSRGLSELARRTEMIVAYVGFFLKKKKKNKTHLYSGMQAGG